MNTQSSAVSAATLASLGKMAEFAEQYHGDAAFQARIQADPHAVLLEQGFELPRSLEIRIIANTDEMFYLPLPPDPNAMLDDEALSVVAGGKSASSAGSAGSASTLGTATGITVGSASSASSAGCAGSAG